MTLTLHSRAGRAEHFLHQSGTPLSAEQASLSLVPLIGLGGFPDPSSQVVTIDLQVSPYSRMLSTWDGEWFKWSIRGQVLGGGGGEKLTPGLFLISPGLDREPYPSETLLQKKSVGQGCAHTVGLASCLGL